MTTIEMDDASAKTVPRKRVSKNKKKNWSKYSDVKDVEDMLTEKRRQMRTGGLVDEKKDTQLFYVDKQTNEDNKEIVVNKRGRRPPRPMKSRANLQPSSLVPAARVKSNHRISGDIKKKCTVKQLNAKNGILTKKEKLKIRHRLEGDKRRDSRRADNYKEHMDKYDLWADKPDVADPSVKRVVKRPVTSLPKPRSKTTPAVEVAHPGASYNPDFEDYQELIKEATEIEVAKIKAQEKIDRAYYHVKEHTVDQLENRYLDEMSIGLFKTDDQWSEDDDEEGGDNSSKLAKSKAKLEGDRCVTGLNPPVRRENKKTPQQRKKQRAQKLHEMQLREAKKERISINEIYRLKSIRKEFKKRDLELEEKKKYKETKALKEESKTRVLGGMKFQAPNLELKLAHELKGSLRLLKPEGNLMEDRFHSLQKRNLIEPRLRAKFKKNKRKEFEKKGHKEVTL